MSQKISRDIADEILASAGAEHSARHGEVIEFPLVSPWLKRKAVVIQATAATIPLWLRAVKYGALLAFFVLGAWIYSSERRESILADIGQTTCSADMSMMWLEEDPGSEVPRLRDAVLIQCAKAHELF